MQQARYAVPALLLIFLPFLCQWAAFYFQGTLCYPLIPVTAIFYFGIFTPTLLNKWVVLVAAIIQDACLGMPVIGISALSYLIIWWMITWQRALLTKETFVILWGAFAVIAAVAQLLIDAIHSVYFLQWYISLYSVFSWFILVVSYPLFQAFHMVIHQWITAR